MKPLAARVMSARMRLLRPIGWWFLLALSLPSWGGIASARAAESGTPRNPLDPSPEAWLGEGADLLLEISHIVGTARKEPAAAKRRLEDILAVAERRQDKAAWLEAQGWWVRLTVDSDPQADISPAMEELLARAREWRMKREEIEVFTLWGELLEGSGQWLPALRAYDRASQAALGAGYAGRGVESLLNMARLCRLKSHPWRLRQAQARVDQVLADRAGEIPDRVREAAAAERAADAVLLAGIPAAAAPVGRVDLQPSDASVLVSAPDDELGRARFVLTNASAFTVSGELRVTPRKSRVTSWQNGEFGVFVALGDEEEAAEIGAGAEKAASRGRLTLLPGQQMSVYLERGPEGGGEKVEISWTDSAGAASAAGTFYFQANPPRASVVNAGVFQLNPGWNIPIYHEIYGRGGRDRLENLAVKAGSPCRLEIFDHDTGRLLATDAEGDGDFTSPGDLLEQDADGDGRPDLVVGDRARALEIHAWPLATSAAKPVTVTVSLADGPSRRSGGAENLVSGY